MAHTAAKWLACTGTKQIRHECKQVISPGNQAMWRNALNTKLNTTQYVMPLNRKYLYLSLSSYTLLTKPHSLASGAIIFLAVNASSRTRLSLPITRGNLCRVPTSAAIPIQMKVIYVTNCYSLPDTQINNILCIKCNANYFNQLLTTIYFNCTILQIHFWSIDLLPFSMTITFATSSSVSHLKYQIAKIHISVAHT